MKFQFQALALLMLAAPAVSLAETTAPVVTTPPTTAAPTDAPSGASETDLDAASVPMPEPARKPIGVSYDSFFFGPGLGQPLDTPPNLASGLASDSGLNFWNLVSAKWRFSERFAFDIQFRNQLIVTNQLEFRHQGQRFGISGKLLGGDDWNLRGAINSDLPVRAIMGQIPSDRTLIFNPGMWATFDYAPKGSRWSLFALLSPRVWFYRERNPVASQDVAACTSGGQLVCDPLSNKPVMDLRANPSVNYQVTPKTGVRLGTTLAFFQSVASGRLQRDLMPMELGVTYDLDPRLSIYTYLQTTTPIDDSVRRNLYGITRPVAWYDTASINLWLSGTIF